MKGEVSIESNVEKLINIKLSLSEVLRPDWKEKSVFPTIESALRGEGVKNLSEGQEISPGEAQTDFDRFIVEANAVFLENNSSYHVRRITDEQGRQKALIVGKVGRDTFYGTARYTLISNDQEGKRVVAWMPDAIGLVSEEGQVLRLDKVLQSGKNPEEENDFLFIEVAGRKYRANMQVISRLGSDTVTFLPENYRQMGEFLHEIGHLLRKRAISRDQKLKEVSSAAHDEFTLTSQTGSPVNPEAKLSPYQTR